MISSIGVFSHTLRLDYRSEFLRAAAIHLFADGLIGHPSNAALASYDEVQNVANYVCLFHDWCPDWAHQRYHDTQIRDELLKFRKRISSLEAEGNKVAAHLNKYYLPTNELGQLELIGEQLKTIYFYMPLTSEDLGEIKLSGRCWTVRHLDYDSLLTATGRTEAEVKAGRDGHWRYGVELEKIYLNAQTGSFFGQYFFRDTNTKDVLCLTAICTTADEKSLSGVANVLSLFKKHFALFPETCRPGRASTATRAKDARRSPKHLSASELVERIPYGADEKEKTRRIKAAERISGLSKEQLIQLATLAQPSPGETKITLPQMEAALEQLRAESRR